MRSGGEAAKNAAMLFPERRRRGGVSRRHKKTFKIFLSRNRMTVGRRGSETCRQVPEDTRRFAKNKDAGEKSTLSGAFAFSMLSLYHGGGRGSMGEVSKIAGVPHKKF